MKEVYLVMIGVQGDFSVESIWTSHANAVKRADKIRPSYKVPVTVETVAVNKSASYLTNLKGVNN